MFKTILVHLTGTECDHATLSTALQIARPFAAHLTCLRVVPDPAALIAQAATLDMGTSMLLADTLAIIEEQGSERTRNARAAMDEFCSSQNIVRADAPSSLGDVSAAWLQRPAADEFECVVAESRFYDLVLLAGGSERPGRLPEVALGSVVLFSGKPVLLAPECPSMTPIKTVAIAWKNRPESAAAITAVMPLLAKAQRVDIFTVNENDAAAKTCIDFSDRVVQQLRWHGLNAHGHFVIAAGRTAADAVLETARGFDADLLLAGAYGHSRMREFIFGGFTQRVLRGAEIPVLLFH